MKLKNILLSKETLIIALIVTCIFGYYKIDSLNDKVYDLNNSTKQYESKIDSLNQQIIVANEKIQEAKRQVKSKQNKIDKLNNQIIVINENYKQKLTEIDNYSSNDIHNELLIIFSENGIK